MGGERLVVVLASRIGWGCGDVYVTDDAVHSPLGGIFIGGETGDATENPRSPNGEREDALKRGRANLNELRPHSFLDRDSASSQTFELFATKYQFNESRFSTGDAVCTGASSDSN